MLHNVIIHTMSLYLSSKVNKVNILYAVVQIKDSKFIFMSI